MPSRAEEFLRGFVEPEAAFSPAPIWWWSGEKLEIGRLRWQMDQLKGMGIYQVVVLNLAPSGTLFGCDADDPAFLSEAWWEIFGQVCDHARAMGMLVWFYDQIGFSGASYQADLAGEYPDCIAEQLRSVSAEGVGELSVTCPGAADVVAVYLTLLDGQEAVSYLGLQVRSVAVDRPSRLRVVYTLRQGYDFFSGPACQRLLDAVHRQFERRLPGHLGTTIVGSFQDELADLPTWGRTFAATFEERNGYSLQSVIHRLFEAGDGDSRRTRLQYHAHRADLAEAAFFKPFYQWHQEHGLRCGFDQQSPAREARVLGCVKKYADYVQTHRWYAIPGSDLHGNGKLHSSIAFMYDRRRVWIEGFHSTGWGGTIADTFDWLLPFLQAGANFYNPHAVYYSMRDGWWEWAAPSTCWRQPYARHYKTFADMIARLTKILSVGVQQAEVGVLFPAATVQAGSGPVDHFEDAAAADEVFGKIIGSMRWHQAKVGVLDELAVDFHILDEATIGLEHRGVRFHTIILPRVTVLHERTVEKLVAFGESGGRVIAVGADVITTVEGREVRVSELAGGIFIESAEGLAGEFGKSPWPVPVLHRREGDLHVLFVPAVAGMATVVKWESWFAPMEHTTIVAERYLKTGEIALPGTARDVWRFDPFSGKAEPFVGGRRLDFEEAPFAVLVWSEEDPHPSPLPEYRARGQEEIKEIALGEEWECEYVIGGCGELSSAATTTEFRWNNGQIVRAGFGVRAWRIDGAGLRVPVVYSRGEGILQDKVHLLTLGPKGYVPEEFIDLGKMSEGQKVSIVYGVVSEQERAAVLAVGANADKAVMMGGESLQSVGPEYLWMTPVKLHRGEHKIELRLTARRDGSVRLYWCLLEPGAADRFGRPERIVAPHAAAAGSLLVYRKAIELSKPLVDGKVKVSVAAMAAVYLDDIFLGRQGGFDPYRPQMRGQTFAVPPLEAGDHELRIEVIQPEREAALMVDGLVMSDATWTVNGEAVGIHDRQKADAAAWMLHRRPHPLLGGQGVLDLPLIAPSDTAVLHTLQWLIPPGANQMRIALADHSEAVVEIDGVTAAINSDGVVRLPGSAKEAVLTITSRELGGGLLLGPVTYEFGMGTLRTGSWLDQGLRSFSGAIRMRQRVNLDAGGAEAVVLDLGRVRGTVEAVINGSPVGVRVMRPYRLEVTEHVRRGANSIELIVTNTLANHLSTSTPTRSWSPDQMECGVFGPVVITLFTTKRD